MKLAQQFNFWVDAPWFYQDIFYQAPRQMARLAHLQDAETGDTLLHLVLRKLNTYTARPTNEKDAYKLDLCVFFALRLLQDSNFTSNIFLKNKQGVTPFQMMKDAKTIWKVNENGDAVIVKSHMIEENPPSVGASQFDVGSSEADKESTVENSLMGDIPIYFLVKHWGGLIDVNNASIPLSAFHDTALGTVNDDSSKIVQRIYRYAQSNLQMRSVNIYDLMFMNAGYTQAMALAVKTKMAMHPTSAGNDASPNENIKPKDLLDDDTFNQSPLTQHRHMLFSWKHGNTHSVQIVFAAEKKRLIRVALGENAALTDENMTQIFQNLLNLLYPLQENRTREILRRPMGKSDIRGYFSKDADTQSYKLILAVLKALAPQYDYEAIWQTAERNIVNNYKVILYFINDPDHPNDTNKAKKGLTVDQRDALNQLAVYAGFQENHYAQEALIDELGSEARFISSFANVHRRVPE